MLVGEAPGEREDYIHKPFQGRAGKLLDSILYAFDIQREDIFITNAVRCRPKDNAKPSNKEVVACAPYLQREIALTRPKLLIALGATGAQALLGEKTPVAASRHRVFKVGKIPCIVTFHPAAALRNDYLTEKIVEDFEWAGRLLKNGVQPEQEEERVYKKVERVEDITEIYDQRVVALDLETDGLDPFIAGRKILSVQLSFKAGTGYYLPWSYAVGKGIRKLVSNPDTTIVNHNIKFDMKWLAREGTYIRGPVRDTLLEAHLLDENQMDKSLDVLATQHTNLRNHKDGVKEYIKKNRCAHRDVPEEIMIPYGCADVDAAIRLHHKFWPRLVTQGLEPLAKLQSRCVKFFTEIESNGCKIDMSRIDEMADYYDKKITKKLKVVTEIGGKDFNDKSPVQIKKLLYDEWELPPMGLVKPWEGKDGYDTTEYTLSRLLSLNDLGSTQRAFLKAILSLRENRKILSTYILGLSDHIRPGDYIHSSFRLDGTVTGRLSSRDINLQNIPREGPIKSLFISRYGSEGMVMQFDLSQAELRFAAHVSGERTLLKLFRAGSTDIHRETAAEVLGIRPEEVTDQQRKKAKTVNFGILYGANKYKMAEQMGTRVEEAARFIAKWKARFSDWPPHERQVRKEVLEKGYVVSPFGRRRRLPIMDPGSKQGKESLRQAINSPIQGGVCDYTLHCGEKAWREMKRAKLDKAHFIAQVHDEWILDVHKSQAKEVVEIMVRNHQEPDLSPYGIKMKVPMVMECGYGPNWGDEKPWS